MVAIPLKLESRPPAVPAGTAEHDVSGLGIARIDRDAVDRRIRGQSRGAIGEAVAAAVQVHKHLAEACPGVVDIAARAERQRGESVAGREKHYQFAAALLRMQLIDPTVLLERIDVLLVAEAALVQWIGSRS